MPAESKVFLDTNVLVYAFGQTAPNKRDRAREILRGDELDWMVSWQVVQEFCAVALHRFRSPMTADELREYLDVVLLPRCRVWPSPELYRQAVGVQARSGYRFYDSLVVASALQGGARLLLSEDMQHGREFGELRVENPFV